MIQNGHGSFVWPASVSAGAHLTRLPTVRTKQGQPTDDDRNRREAALKKLSKDAVAAGQ